MWLPLQTVKPKICTNPLNFLPKLTQIYPVDVTEESEFLSQTQLRTLRNTRKTTPLQHTHLQKKKTQIRTQNPTSNKNTKFLVQTENLGQPLQFAAPENHKIMCYCFLCHKNHQEISKFETHMRHKGPKPLTPIKVKVPPMST